MANRLVAFRVALELQGRRGRGGRAPSFDMSDLTGRLLRCLARAHRDDRVADLAAWDDYELATQAGVSVRQTRELYEEAGMGLLVREALDVLRERDLISVARCSPSGPYRGFAPTPGGLAAVNVDPWYRRLLAFFDPPPEEAGSRSLH